MKVSTNNTHMFSMFTQRFGQGSMMKSTREKLQRQEKAQNQIDYWEGQKENLKEMECDTVEEVARKLELFHSYEDQIASVKQAYNFEQMHHVLDEAQEQGEKIAEAAEKTKPKTEEERKKEAAEEAAGTEDTGGVLGDMLDELTEQIEELVPELSEGLVPGLSEELVPEVTEEVTDVRAQSMAEEPGPGLLGKQQEEPGLGQPEELPERQAQKLVKEHQRYQELAREYADMAGDRGGGRRAQFDYRM